MLRMLLALATSKDSHRRKVCGIWDVSVPFFHSPMDKFTVVRPLVGLGVRGKLWVLKRALYGTRMASRCFGKLVGEVLTDAQFEAVTVVPNTNHHPQRDIDTVVHGDDIVAVAEDDHLNFLERVLENSMEIKRVGKFGHGRSSAGKGAQTYRQLDWRWIHLGGRPETVGKVAETAEPDRKERSDSSRREGHWERRSRCQQ